MNCEVKSTDEIKEEGSLFVVLRRSGQMFYVAPERSNDGHSKYTNSCVTQENALTNSDTGYIFTN